MRWKNRSNAALAGACLALAILMGVVLTIRPALAETPPSVSGADHVYTDETNDGQVDILTVTGKAGETVYINMGKGQEVLANHLAFTLDENNAQADANGDMVGVVSVEFAADSFSHEDTYSIQVYGERAETTQLYNGTVSTYYAQYKDVNTTEPLVVRTLEANENRPFTAPQTRTYNGITYQLESPDPQDVGGKQCYVYAPAAEVADSVEGHVTYYDIDDTSDAIRVDIVALAKGESKQAPIPSVIESKKDGALYRTLQLSDSVTVAYPGAYEYSVMCKRLSDDWGKVGKFYTATINYVDEKDNWLGLADTVIVNKPYTYTAPTRIYIKDDSGTVRQYQLKDAAVHKLEPGDTEEDSKTYNITYEPISDKAKRTWTVVCENGSVAPNDPKRIIQSECKDYRGEPGTTAKHVTKQKISVDGVDYVPSAAAQDVYEHEFGVADMDVEQHIYYVPDGYVAPEAYQVTVKYVNIATNAEIDSASYTASPSMRSDLEMEAPESFSANGVEWIRLNGQEAPIRHSFYSPVREYVVYYRDVNDDLHAATVIRTVRVVYEDAEGNTVRRPTTIINNGTNDTGTTNEGTANAGTANSGTTDAGTTDEGTAAAGTAGGGADAVQAAGGGATGNAAGQTTDTGLQTGTDLRTVDGPDGNALVDEGGNDLATTRIEDDANPLAGPSASKGDASIAGKNAALIGGIAAAAAVAAALIFFFVFKRRKQCQDESSDDDLTA